MIYSIHSFGLQYQYKISVHKDAIPLFFICPADMV